MDQFDIKIDLIKYKCVGDLYFMVQWFSLIFDIVVPMNDYSWKSLICKQPLDDRIADQHSDGNLGNRLYRKNS